LFKKIDVVRDDGAGQREPVREMAVQGGLTDAGPAGDLGHPDRRVWTGHHLGRGLQDRRPVAEGVAAASRRGTVEHCAHLLEVTNVTGK
jgi:hypothetical protein